MNLREDMLAVYRKQPSGKVVLGSYSRYLPRSAVERHVRNGGMGIIEYFPAATMIAPPWHFYEGYLSQVKGTDITVRHFWEHGKRIERREWITPVGTLTGEIEYDPAGAGSEHIRKHYIAEPEDYGIMTWVVENTLIESNAQEISRRTEILGEDGVLLGRLDRTPYQKCLIELAGPERFLVDLFTMPEKVEPLLNAIDMKLEEQCTLAAESGVQVIWQPDNVTCDMTPPDAFRKYCLPLYQKNSRRFAELGIPYLVHMDGKVKALAGEINASGIDAIESFSIPDMGGDLEVAEAQALFPEIGILPNFPSNWSALGENELREKLSGWLAGMDRKKAVMLQISEDIPSSEWMRIFPVITDQVRIENAKR